MTQSETGKGGIASGSISPAPDLQSIVGTIVDAVQTDRSRLMDIVQAVQQRLGYLSDEAIHAIASRLGIHGVEVEDMASFYAFLNREPKGRFHIRLSKTPISLMKGATALAQAFSAATGATIGGTSQDGEFTLEWTNDIGMGDLERQPDQRNSAHRSGPGRCCPIIAALRQHHAANGIPLFPGSDVQGAGLSKARISASLVKSGPVFFSWGWRWPVALERPSLTLPKTSFRS